MKMQIRQSFELRMKFKKAVLKENEPGLFVRSFAASDVSQGGATLEEMRPMGSSG